MTKDQSILGEQKQKDITYLNDLAIAICINGDSLKKYEKMVVKRYGEEVYANMSKFVEELKRQKERNRFTNTSLVSLNYLGKNVSLTEETVSKIINHFEKEFKEEQVKREETELWKLCRLDDQNSLLHYLTRYPNGIYSAQAKSLITNIRKKEIEENRAFNHCQEKTDYDNYLRKYPNGRYCKEAQAKIETFKKEEAYNREEATFWSRCQIDDKHSLQTYLSKYPNGKHAIQARSFIADLEKKEQEAIEENRLYNRCMAKEDYVNYLRKYPNGRYCKEAQAKIETFKKEEAYNREEATFWSSCRQDDKNSLQAYLSKYPNGKHAIQARSFIADLEKKEQEASTIADEESNKRLDRICWIIGIIGALWGLLNGGIGLAIIGGLGGCFVCAIILVVIEKIVK